MVAAAAVHKEALRQQMLLRALLGDARPGVVAGWLRDRPERVTRGLQAYRANAAALAEKVLAAAFPTVAQLLGNEAAAGLARAYWRAEPPQRGDMAWWGEGLPAFIAADPQLASEPYLADVARLDWAVHLAEMAADAPAPSGLQPGPEPGLHLGLHLLASTDPASLWLQMVPGTALVSSVHPVVTIWQAHRPALAGGAADDRPDRFAAVRAAFAAGSGEHALVARGSGDWQAGVVALPASDAAFTAALLAGGSLAEALASADAAFDFERWLIEHLHHRRIAAVTTQPVASRR